MLNYSVESIRFAFNFMFTAKIISLNKMLKLLLMRILGLKAVERRSIGSKYVFFKFFLGASHRSPIKID